MLHLENHLIRVTIHPETLRGEVRLKGSGDVWIIDARGTGGCLAESPAAAKVMVPRFRSKPDLEPLPSPELIRAGENEISFLLKVPTAQMRVSIRLVPNTSSVEFAAAPLTWGPGAISDLVFPGSIYQEGVLSRVAIPALQGLLYTGKGEAFQEHQPLRMRWWGVLGAKSSYIAIVETPDDAAFFVGKDHEGRVHSKIRWLPSLGELAYERRITYHFKDQVTSYVPLAKEFRKYAKKNGLFKSLREKMEERPLLDRFIGAVHVFLGYQKGDVDYLGSLKRLKRMGIERAFCFPLFFCNWTPFVIKGTEAISQGHIVQEVQRELGYLCSPWMWNWEMLTRAPEYSPELILKDSDGGLAQGWKIEEDVWQVLNQQKAAELMKKYENDFMACDAFHFDVTTSHGLLEDYSPRRPMSRSEDREARIRMFRWLTDRGKIVGSEGFWDWAAPHYDYGTTKSSPRYGDEKYWTIPLMGLVYHDSVVHTWWEVDGYNDVHSFTGRGGRMVDQSLQDILYNDPPLIFPVGKQYYWTNIRARTVEFHQYTLDTPGVMESVRRAIYVAKLHRRHGLEELLEHRFVTDDGSVQETVFESGVTIAVNFSDKEAESSDGKPIPARGWTIDGRAVDETELS